MSKTPPVHEREFIKITRNHGEYLRNLATLKIEAPELPEYVEHLCKCWFTLAEEHLKEAELALGAKCTRAVFSRAYYSAYNASKAVRYVVRGNVSLAGDDHKFAAADLPEDLPEVDKWAQQITLLYEHRLRADYDNWSDTTSSATLSPADAVKSAIDFTEVARSYLKARMGMAL